MENNRLFNFITDFFYKHNIKFECPKRLEFDAKRRSSYVAQIGQHLSIGGNNPIVIQSMTNTETRNIEATVNQCKLLFDSGALLVRIAIVNLEDALSVECIRSKLDSIGCYGPISLCMHFNAHILFKSASHSLKYAQKFRINPGNVGIGDRYDKNLEYIVSSIMDYGENKSIRIGANYGSIQNDTRDTVIKFSDRYNIDLSKDEADIVSLVISVVTCLNFIESLGFPKQNIVVSCKLSDSIANFIANSLLARVCRNAMHVGTTECGGGMRGVINATSGISSLLVNGIGDTIRASITAYDQSDRYKEVVVCHDILSSLNMLSKNDVKIISCPGCGRTNAKYFSEVVREISDFIENNIINSYQFKSKKNLDTVKIAIMGCIVNGPGESKSADFAISFPGSDEKLLPSIYIDGKRQKGNFKSSEEAVNIFKRILAEKLL